MGKSDYSTNMIHWLAHGLLGEFCISIVAALALIGLKLFCFVLNL